MKKKITDIQIEGRDACHRILFLDGERFRRVDAGLITKLGVRVGLEIEEAVLHKLIQADEIIRAKNYAAELLKDQVYSKGQMFVQLEGEGFGQNAIDTTLKELEQLGQIKDEKYAQTWIKKRQRSKPKGKKMLRYELLDKGIDPTTVNRTLETIDDDDEDQLALQAAQKQAVRYKSLPSHVAKRRLHNFLLRRGFGYETIQKTMRQVLNEVDRK